MLQRLSRNAANGENAGLLAFDEDDGLFAGLDRHGAAHGNVNEIGLDSALAHLELDVDLRRFLLRLHEDLRSVRHFERCILQIAALHLEDRRFLLFGSLLRIGRTGRLNVFVFGHFYTLVVAAAYSAWRSFCRKTGNASTAGNPQSAEPPPNRSFLYGDA